VTVAAISSGLAPVGRFACNAAMASDIDAARALSSSMRLVASAVVGVVVLLQAQHLPLKAAVDLASFASEPLKLGVLLSP